MSHLLRRPLFRASRLTPSKAPSLSRCFSSYTPLHGLKPPGQMTAPRAAMPRERSMRALAMQQQQANGMIPSDVGILEKTFITPTVPNIPSPLRELPAFLRLQWNRLYLHGRDYISLLIVKWSSPKNPSFFKRTFHISRAQTAPAAIALHTQMYSGFAAGDVSLLRRICCDGIHETFASRIANRDKNEKVEWQLVKHNKRPKVVSHRAARMPADGTGIRQAVVRICSRQKLTRSRIGKDGKKEVLAGSGREKDVVEYLVVQRIWRDWEEGEWKVWGTTGETTLEDVEMWERRAIE